jgi:hypothetical protein
MFYVFFAFRVVLALAFLAIQVYLVNFSYAWDESYVQTLSHQVGLQIAAVVVAPAGTRLIAAFVTAWMSLVLGMAVIFTWVTVVIPIAGIIAWSIHGDPMIIYYLVACTAYLAIPVGIMYVALHLDL